MSTVTLTQKQREVVDFPDEGDLLVRGIPGAGKSTVLLARAHKQQRALVGEGKHNQVILVTYSTRLRQWMDWLARACGAQPPRVYTFHTLAGELLRASGDKRATVEGEQRDDLIRQAVEKEKTVRPHRLLEQKVRFWSEEIQWIKGRMLDRQKYMAASRTGRGAEVRVTRADRDVIFEVYQHYQTVLRGGNFRDYDDYATEIVQRRDRIKDRQVLHVLVDEAQDLYPAQVMALSYISNKSLTLAADKAQNIYRTGFSWKELGINVRGSRNKQLDGTFRSTREIMAVAMELKKQEQLDDEDTPVIMPDKSGPKPKLYVLNDPRTEADFVADLVTQMWRARPDDTFAVIARAYRLPQFRSALRRMGCAFQDLDGRSDGIGEPGVKLVSFHSAKGLEFDHVVVTGLSDGILPGKRAETLDADDAKDFIAAERRLLYVALTRARMTVALIAPAPASTFLHEISAELYDRQDALRPLASRREDAERYIKPAAQQPPTQSFEPVGYFRAKGLTIVDRRASGGSLWVMGGAELSGMMSTVRDEFGYRFGFAPQGGKATGNRPAWYTDKK